MLKAFGLFVALIFLMSLVPVWAANIQVVSAAKNSDSLASAPQEDQGITSSQPNASGPSPERGKGLANAIKHVPSFVAEKLSYSSKLFADGVRGIGQSLSDWIHSFFKPVAEKKNEAKPAE